MKTFIRRTISITAVLLGLLLLGALLPLFLVAVLLFDAVTRRQWATTRALGMLMAYFVLEVTGLFGALLTLLASTLLSAERYFQLNFALQRWWVKSLFAVLRWLFDLTVEVQGDEALANGPYVLLPRHTSYGDALLAVSVIGGQQGIHLRCVLKKELLWEPCLDVVGHRLPNFFLHRASPDRDNELDGIRRMMHGIGDHEGALIFPEGTRFTPRKRAALLARGDAISKQAATLQHVLPLRPKGVQTLLDACPSADVVLMAHTGFETTSDLPALFRGELVGKTIRVRFLRQSRVDVPKTPVAQRAWLTECWQQMDAMVAELQNASHA